MNSLRNVLTQLEKAGAALGHFNVADLALLKAILAAAHENRSPVIVGASEGERDFLGTRQLASLVKSLREESDLPIFLNADHTHSLAKAMEAANAGFDLVGIDFSALPLEQNVLRTKEAVEAIKAINPAILADGEIGDIGTGSEIHEKVQNRSLTTPEEASQFVRSSGIDILAPAVGNMHGMLKTMVGGYEEAAARHCKDRSNQEGGWGPPPPCTAGQEPMMGTCERYHCGNQHHPHQYGTSSRVEAFPGRESG